MKKQLKLTASQKQSLIVATVIALVFGAYFLRHYFTLIIFAAILAFLFDPVYKKRLKKGNSPGKASAITLLIAFFSILIPVIFILILTGFQINEIVKTVSSEVNSVDVSNFTQRMIDVTNELLAKTPIDFRVTEEWLQQTAVTVIQNVGYAILDKITSYASNFFSFFTTAIIFIFVFLSLLKNQGANHI